MTYPLIRLIGLASVVFFAGCALTPPPVSPPELPAAVVTPKRPPRIGLVLGGGAARGFAHVGVLKAFEQAGIEVDVIVGVSSGAVVAALHAGGMRAAELEANALAIEGNDLLDFTLFGPGVIEGGRLQAYINDMLHNRPIEALQKPFAVIAAERETSRMMIFNRGNTGLAVRASASAGLIDSVVKLGLYFVHERIWNYIPLGRPKRPEYEI